MKTITIFFLSFVCLLFSSCETVVDLDLEQSAPRLTVEAIITDQAGLNYVQLNLSAPYAKNQEPPAVTDAQVSVSDNSGVGVSFQHIGNGLYKPDANFKGIVGRTYTLSVQTNGQHYTATTTLNAVPVLDKVKYEYVDGKSDAYGREKGYYVSTAFQDIAGIRNFYKLDLLVNGQLKQRNANDILVTEDKLYDGSYLDDLNIFISFEKGDQVELRLLSLNKEAYEFYLAVQGLAGQGGLFGRNPANLPTNISNGAVGFFSASAVATKTVTIQ